MNPHYKDAVTVCKAILRNGYEAYVINARLQAAGLPGLDPTEVDVSTDASFDELQRLYPAVRPQKGEAFARLAEGDTVVNFLRSDQTDATHPEQCLTRLTTRLAMALAEAGELPGHAVCLIPGGADEQSEVFADFSEGHVRLRGIPDQDLRRDYLRAIRAMRFSANFDIPIEPNTWMAILRSSRRVLEYVSVSDILSEWRKVEAENMAAFVNLLYESMILHGLIPEIAALGRIRQRKNDAEEETVFDHTLAVMRRYPEELPYDWFGVLACLFHDVGKLHTAEHVQGVWTFHQHHRVGANVTRKILARLGMDAQDINLVCHLVRHHMRFHFMLTDKGIRRFKALEHYPRLIEMVRADIKARDGRYKEFNHNMKMLDRTQVREEELEPLLNGNEIMTITGLPPGSTVGVIREALLQAQIVGDVADVDQAMEFVRNYSAREQLG